MSKRAVLVLAALAGLIGPALLVDWQLSKGSVTTRDGVTLIEDNRARLFESVSVAGMGFTGNLAMSSEGCVGTISPTGVFASIIWQHGTSLVSTDPLTVQFGGRTYREGDEIESGASEGSASGETYESDIPDSCEADQYVFVTEE
ncbi:hypothetical protein [Aeromicrobium sp. NPDC092404]|uniref:hypothetical protein n=1 Tax=Aeromicrobium sp. NPDC092404 TaxID=3154976 RepID=UPI003428D637